MVKNLVIPADENKPYFPSVAFNANGTFKLTGSSFMENAVVFYDQILNWLEDFMETKQEVNFHIYLEYFNTSSAKGINNILIMLDEYANEGAKVEATWYYQEGDYDGMEEGLDYKEEVEFPFHVKSYTNFIEPQMVA